MHTLGLSRSTMEYDIPSRSSRRTSGKGVNSDTAKQSPPVSRKAASKDVARSARKKDAYSSLSATGVRAVQGAETIGAPRPLKRTSIQVPSQNPARRSVSDTQPLSQPPTAFPPLTRIRTTSASSSRPTPRPRTASAASSIPASANTPPPRYSNLSSRPPSSQSHSEERSRAAQAVPVSAPPAAPSPGRFPGGILRKRPNAPTSITLPSRNVSLHLPAASSAPRSPRSPGAIAELVRRLSKKRVRFKSVSSRRTMSDRGTPYASPERSPVRAGRRRGATPLPPLEDVPVSRPAPIPSRPPPSPFRPDRRIPSPNPGPPPSYITPRRAPSPMNPPRVIPPTPPMPPARGMPRAPSPSQSPQASLAPRIAPSAPVTTRTRARTPSPIIPPLSPPVSPLAMQLVGVEGPYPPYRRREPPRVFREVEEPSVARARVAVPPPAPAMDLRLSREESHDDGQDEDSDEESVGVPPSAPMPPPLLHSRHLRRRLFRGVLNPFRRKHGGFDGDPSHRVGSNTIGRCWKSLLRACATLGSGSRRLRLKINLPLGRKRKGGGPAGYSPEPEYVLRHDAVSTPPLPPLPRSRTPSPALPPLPPARRRSSTPPPPLRTPPLPPPRTPPPPPLLHPLLRAPTRAHPGHLTWDMRYPDLPPHYAGSPFIKQSLFESATDPPSEQLTLLIPTDMPTPPFWSITLHPRPGHPAIRCIDLLKSTASTLRIPFTPSELSLLTDSLSPARLARVERAFQERCRGGEQMGQRGEERERRVGWRRVDALAGEVVWRGVRWVPAVDGWVVELEEV